MIFIFIAILAQTVSFIFGKTAALNYVGIDRYLSFWYMGSLLSFGLKALVWQQALKRLTLSVAYPMMSFVFVIIPVIGFFVFNESISWMQLVGTAVIVVGTVLIASDVGDASHE